ncbi:MAG: SGNH/GDSL hydrolase family protein [Nocardioides sp.]|uniref:SGNH/GDSL hydrolase family protein n=1 Tax=Nocardioides sp. TaxID=35761 RepID=UPI003EFD8D55
MRSSFQRAVRAAAVTLALPLAASMLLVPSAQGAGQTTQEHVPVWDKGTGGERYVSLGDSFTSGPGIAPMRAECGRSEKNFPTLLATTLDVTAFTDASCGGAQTKDLWAPQTWSSGAAPNAPQLDALGEDTTLVTFGTLGGNDIGLVGLAQACAFGTCVPASGTDPLAAKFATVRTELARGLADARSRAPHARMVVVGYSTYLSPGECGPLASMLTADESAYLQSQIDRLSDTLSDVATDGGALFVDQRLIPGAVDHTVCAAPNKQWIRALNTYNDGVTFHPSACGMDAIAQYLRIRIAEDRGETAPAFDGSCVSAGPGDPDPEPDDTEARLEALNAKAATVKATASCTRVRGVRTVRFAARGGEGALAGLRVRIAGKRIGIDTTAPFRVDRRAAKVARTRGALSAVVRLRDKELSVYRTVRLTRPGCAR